VAVGFLYVNLEPDYELCSWHHFCNFQEFGKKFELGLYRLRVGGTAHSPTTPKETFVHEV